MLDLNEWCYSTKLRMACCRSIMKAVYSSVITLFPNPSELFNHNLYDLAVVVWTIIVVDKYY